MFGRSNKSFYRGKVFTGTQLIQYSYDKKSFKYQPYQP
jgi:hypothetical protein